MKKIILFLFFLPSLCLAKTIKIKDPGNYRDIQPNIQVAVNSSIDGDIISLPDGEFIFGKRIYTSKKISFLGTGIRIENKGTLLYRDSAVTDSYLENSWPNMFYFDINTRDNAGITISGITFRGKAPSVKQGDGGSMAADNAIYLRYVTGFTITNCRFEYFGESAIHVKHYDDIADGLINKNEFYKNAKGVDGLGLGYGVVVYGENKQWVSDPKFGSKNFIFIEDNTFELQRHAVAAGGCALYVFRYNKVTNNLISSAVDAHESDGSCEGSNKYATRAVEVYNNLIVNTLYKDHTLIGAYDNKDVNLVAVAAIGIRGGEALVHHNTIKGFLYGCQIITYYLPENWTYPVPFQPGYVSGLALGRDHAGAGISAGRGDVFYYSNNFTPHKFDNTKGWFTSQSFFNANPWPLGPFKDGRDYHLTKKTYKTYTYPHPNAT